MIKDIKWMTDMQQQLIARKEEQERKEKEYKEKQRWINTARKCRKATRPGFDPKKLMYNTKSIHIATITSRVNNPYSK